MNQYLRAKYLKRAGGLTVMELGQLKKGASWVLERPWIVAILIVLIALGIRVYFLSTTTSEQPLWWDEAEYLLQAKHWAFGTPNTGFGDVRPVGFSAFAAILYILGANEIGLRVVEILFSVAGVWLIYLLGKELYGQRVGILSSFVLAVFYLDIFHSQRLLVDVPATTLQLAAAYLLVQGLRHEKYRIWYLYSFVPVLVLSFLIRFTSVLFVVPLGAYILGTHGWNFLKRREFLVSALIGLALLFPFFVYSYLTYGDILHSVLRAGGSGFSYATEAGFSAGLDRLGQYVGFWPTYFREVFLVIFIIGLALALKSLLVLDKIFKRNYEHGAVDVFVLSWAAIFLIYYGFFFHVFDPRYLTPAFPALFLLVGKGLDKIYSTTHRYHAMLAPVLVVALLLFGGYQQFKQADALIKIKANSYQELKDAGIWIKANSQPQDVIVSSGVPANTYYSERATYSIPGNFEDFEKILQEKKPKYLILSVFEKSPEWAYAWPQQNKDKAAPVWGKVMSENNQPLVVIYQLLY